MKILTTPARVPVKMVEVTGAKVSTSVPTRKPPLRAARGKSRTPASASFNKDEEVKKPRTRRAVPKKAVSKQRAFKRVAKIATSKKHPREGATEEE
jgi:hypothetical protein